MNVKPILFNTEMVRAILGNRKTVTRRVVKPKPLWQKPPVQQKGYPEYWANWDDEKVYKSPYRPSDILYVRETWQHGFGGTYLYKASAGYDLFMTPEGKLVSDIPWRPSIHMPREAARIFLRVTNVRVERLQDITEEQAIKEGIEREYIDMDVNVSLSAKNVFADIWDSTIKPKDRALYGWNANPWVWVIEFERIRKEDVYL